MLALLAFAGTGEPVGKKFNVPVSLWDIIKVDLVGKNRFNGVVACHSLDDELALELEEDMVRGERSHRLWGDGFDVGRDRAASHIVQ